jgi:mono/diheme cytochrome c family protein
MASGDYRDITKQPKQGEQPMKSVYLAASLIALASVAKAETIVKRGEYLVTTIGGCGNCHTPRQGGTIEGKVIPGTELSGGLQLDEDVGHLSMPNITPDIKTGIGEWTDNQIVMGLRDGRRPDGKIIGPPMPIPMYRNLSDNDASSIATYLLTLKPVNHAVPRSVYKIPLPENYGPPVSHVDEPSPTDQVTYGKYLVTFGHCVLCHTPEGKDQPFDMSRAFAGGRKMPNGSVTRNITSDPEDGLGRWTDAQIKVSITESKRPDGTALNRIMAFDWYKGITQPDLDSIVAYLRTIPPQKTP